MLRAIPILVTITLLAGCVGGGNDPVETATADDAGAPVSPAPASPSAGASSSSTTTSAKPASTSASATNASAAANATPPAPVKLPYEWSSTLPPEACVPLAVLGCAGAIAQDGWWDQPAFTGTPKHAKLDLTWTASPGGITDMRFALVRATSCEGDGCWTGEAILDVAGPSPLALDLDVPALDEGEFLIVVARQASIVPDPLYGFAHGEQAFDVTGEFLVQN